MNLRQTTKKTPWTQTCDNCNAAIKVKETRGGELCSCCDCYYEKKLVEKSGLFFCRPCHSKKKTKQEKAHNSINITAKPLLAELLRSQAELAKPKSYPIKQFLLSRSYLVKYNEKEATGKELSRLELSKQTRICELMNRVYGLITYHLERYYNKVINGDYRYDGMPKIERGIKGWIERKVWKLLVLIAEPNHERFKHELTTEYWEETK